MKLKLVMVLGLSGLLLLTAEASAGNLKAIRNQYTGRRDLIRGNDPTFTGNLTVSGDASIHGSLTANGAVVLADNVAPAGAGSIRYNSTDVALEYYDGSAWHDSGSPKHIYIASATQSEGNLDLSDGTNWNKDNAIIKTIQVVTSSTDYDLALYPDDDFDSVGISPPLTISNGASGNNAFFLDHAYSDDDDTKEVHLRYIDNSGTNTADVYIKGFGLR